MGLFSDVQAQLSGLLGSAQPLESKNGVRFRSGSKGVATLYSRDIADGNLAEIAFEVENLAARTGKSKASVTSLIDSLRLETGQRVKTNTQHQWPRVGLSKKAHVDMVIAALSAILRKE